MAEKKKKSAVRSFKQFCRMTCFEMRKCFGNKAMLFILLFLLLFNAWQAGGTWKYRSGFANAEHGQKYGEVYREMYERFSGRITKEKINELLAIYRPILKKSQEIEHGREYDPNSYIYSAEADERFFSKFFVDEMRYDYLYQNNADAIRRKAQENMALYQELGEEYEYRKNLRIAKDFWGRKIDNFFYTEMWHYYFAYDKSSLMVLLLCIFGLSGMFVMERETEMYMLLRTSKNGGRLAGAAKIAAAALFVCGICLLFWTEDFLAFAFRFQGWREAAKSPLYALTEYQNTPHAMTIGGFAILLAGIKTLGIWGCSVLYMGVSALCRNMIVPFGVSICGTVWLVWRQFVSLGNAAKKLFNPLELVEGKMLFYEDRFVNVAGWPLRMHWIVTASVALLSAVLAVVLLLYGTGRPRALRGRQSPKHQKEKRSLAADKEVAAC